MDTSKKFWMRPRKGWQGMLLWAVPIAAAAFIAVFCINFVSATSVANSAGQAVLIAVIVAVVSLLAFLFIRWLCCWKNLRRFLFGVACFVTLVVLIYAVENFRGKRAWENHKRELEAKGEKFSIIALAPPPVPDEKNFALTPLLKSAMDFEYGTNGIMRRDTNGYARLERTSPHLTMPGGKHDDLKLGNMDKGTLADLEACRDFYRGNTNYPQPLKSGTAAEDILVALGRFDPELQELREAAATRPDARFPIKYDHQPATEILLPHLAPLKGLCQLLQGRAIAELELGRSDKAWQDLKVAFRITDSIRDEPIQIDHLVRISMLNMNLQTIREGLERQAWTDAQLVELEQYLATVNLLAGYKLAMRGERALVVNTVDYVRRNRGLTTRLLDDAGDARAMVLMPSGWYYQNMLVLSQFHQDYTLPAVDEHAHRALPGIVEKISEVFEHPSRPYTIFTKYLLPAVSKGVQRAARMQFYLDAARLACALERHRLATGKLPDALDALAPKYLPTIPNDVMTGKPLHYRTDAEGYTIYSEGWNLKDDGGELGWAQEKKKTVDITQGDWVWKTPAPAPAKVDPIHTEKR